MSMSAAAPAVVGTELSTMVGNACWSTLSSVGVTVFAIDGNPVQRVRVHRARFKVLVVCGFRTTHLPSHSEFLEPLRPSSLATSAEASSPRAWELKSESRRSSSSKASNRSVSPKRVCCTSLGNKFPSPWWSLKSLSCFFKILYRAAWFNSAKLLRRRPPSATKSIASRTRSSRNSAASPSASPSSESSSPLRFFFSRLAALPFSSLSTSMSIVQSCKRFFETLFAIFSRSRSCASKPSRPLCTKSPTRSASFVRRCSQTS